MPKPKKGSLLARHQYEVAKRAAYMNDNMQLEQMRELVRLGFRAGFTDIEIRRALLTAVPEERHEEAKSILEELQTKKVRHE